MRYLLLLAIFLSTSVAYASTTVGTIDPTYKYAWSNVGGYINLAPTQGGLTVTDSAVTGYAWSANSGYINFDTSLSGVTNDGEGNLGGFAWGEGSGWISFSDVTIDSDGKFNGVAQGGTVNGAPYQITFDCSNCDVRTDWRPVSVRGGSDDSGAGRGGSSRGSRVTPPPGSELPNEPTTPPPAEPTVTEGEGVNTSNPQIDSNGDGIPDTYVPGGLPSTTVPGQVADVATNTPKEGENPLLPIIGGILGLVALLSLMFFFYRKG